MAVSKEKAKRVAKYSKKHGVEKAMSKFELSSETISRYMRVAKSSYLPDVNPAYRKRQLSEGYRVLCIGDLHTPFDLEEYFDHCVSVYHKYECNKVVFIGDIIDNHFSSYHETDSDGMGGMEELECAINRLARWYKAFPEADVIIGNHDRMVMRKAQTSAIPTIWIKDYVEVLKTPGWRFIDSVVYDDVQYVHGEGGAAVARSVKDQISVVQGHLHTKCFTIWSVGIGRKTFAMQVGCGVDKDTYAMAYAKNFGTPAIGCGVILNGKVAINEVMSVN